MGRGRDLRPARVYQTVKRSLEIPTHTKGEIPPVWLKALERYPPSEMLTRPKPTVHQDPNPRQRRVRRVFRPQAITFPEDSLRRTFFRDHPWELARPRIAVELDGKDARYVDWNRGLKQPGWILSGESVVQRQLWLMENHKVPKTRIKNPATGETETIYEPISKEAAYDIVRKEFYTLRQREEIERRIAAEEATHVGAYFGKSRLEIGMELEAKTWDKWKSWAMAENAKAMSDRASQYTNYSAEDERAANDALLQSEMADLVDTPGSQTTTP